jgi:hypothetical protein
MPRYMPGKPSDPHDHDCGWCERQAIHAFELYKPGKKFGTGQFVYACGRHLALAKNSARAPKAAA